MTVTILYKTNLLLYLYAANLFKYVTCFLLLSKQCTEIICKSLARKKKGQQVISDRQRAYIYNSWIQKSVSNMRKYISNGFFFYIAFLLTYRSLVYTRRRMHEYRGRNIAWT